MFDYFLFFFIMSIFLAVVIHYTIGWRGILEKILPVIVVEKQKAVIIDNRLGVVGDRVINEGIHFYIPFLEAAVGEVSLKEQQIDPPPHDVISKDNVKLEIDMIGFYKIKDPMKALFEIEDYKKALEALIISEALKRLGLMNFNDVQVKQDSLAEEIKKKVQLDANRWGIEIIKVEFEDISPPQSIKEAMEKEVVAQKEKTAAITKAEGEHRVLELQADSEKILIEKKAEALHKAIEQFKALMPNISDEKIMQFLTSNAHIDSIKELSKSSGTKFVLYPSDAEQPLEKAVTSEYLSRDTATINKELPVAQASSDTKTKE